MSYCVMSYFVIWFWIREQKTKKGLFFILGSDQKYETEKQQQHQIWF